MHSVPWQLLTSSLFLNLHCGTTQYGNKKWSTISSRLRTVTENCMWTQPQQQAGKLTTDTWESCFLHHWCTGLCKELQFFLFNRSKRWEVRKEKGNTSSSLHLTKLKQRVILLPLPRAELRCISWAKLTLHGKWAGKTYFSVPWLNRGKRMTQQYITPAKATAWRQSLQCCTFTLLQVIKLVSSKAYCQLVKAP